MPADRDRGILPLVPSRSLIRQGQKISSLVVIYMWHADPRGGQLVCYVSTILQNHSVLFTAVWQDLFFISLLHNFCLVITPYVRVARGSSFAHRPSPW
jgi:hypothetical protein